MSYNMMICYDIYDCFTMEHFRLRQRMTLTTKIYCSRLYVTTVALDLFEHDCTSRLCSKCVKTFFPHPDVFYFAIKLGQIAL
jgi:hypothetical protein